MMRADMCYTTLENRYMIYLFEAVDKHAIKGLHIFMCDEPFMFHVFKKRRR